MPCPDFAQQSEVVTCAIVSIAGKETRREFKKQQGIGSK